MNLRVPYLAKYVLVRWPDAHDMTLPSCITLDALPDALARGAVHVGREWDIAEYLISSRETWQSGPRRHKDPPDYA